MLAAFLVSESTMAARITRAKKKIAAAHIPYRLPARDEPPARTDAVLDPYLAATRADCLRELGRSAEARRLYEEAILVTGKDVERAFLVERLHQLCG